MVFLNTLLRRVLIALLTYVVVNLFIFTVPRLMPGNYVDYIASSRFLPQQAVMELYERFGLNEPFHVQLIRYITNVMFSPKPDFGYSYSFYPYEAWDVIKIYLPWTVLLLSVATIATFILGTLLGFIAAYTKDSILDRLIVGFSIYTISTPYFILALIVLAVFSQYLRLFPAGGAYSASAPQSGLPFIQNILWHLFLPVMAIAIGTSGQFVILTREIIVSNMSEDFYRTAMALGLRRIKILMEYALRPGILPLITLFGIRFGTMMSGALLTEIIFSYPGLGYILYQAILSKDFPLLQALFYMISFMIIATSLILDILYMILDPRIRRG